MASVTPVDSTDTSLFSSLGVGSGLPLDTLMTQLQTSEEAGLQPIQQQENTTSATLSAYGQLQSAVSALQAAAQTLTTSGTFNALQATVSGSALTASTASGAVAGQYSITVDQLAKPQTLYTTGQASATAANGTGGTLTLTLGDGTTHTLDLTGKDTSLNGLVEAINSDSSLGVSATLINDGSSSPYHLLLGARSTGRPGCGDHSQQRQHRPAKPAGIRPGSCLGRHGRPGRECGTACRRHCRHQPEQHGAGGDQRGDPDAECGGFDSSRIVHYPGHLACDAGRARLCRRLQHRAVHPAITDCIRHLHEFGQRPDGRFPGA
ncbi:hypothetical protein CDEF62S_01598 [Castellaniella defragrans]